MYHIVYACYHQRESKKDIILKKMCVKIGVKFVLYIISKPA